MTRNCYIGKLKGGGDNMEKYIITAFEKSGETVLDESFDAQDDKEAKKVGEELLKQKGFENHTARVVSSAGKLIVLKR